MCLMRMDIVGKPVHVESLEARLLEGIDNDSKDTNPTGEEFILFANSLANFLGMSASFILTLVFIPLVIGSLGEIAFGILSLGLGFLGIASLFYMGITDSVSQLIGSTHQSGSVDLRKSLGLSFVYYLPIACVPIVAMFFFGPFVAGRFFHMDSTYTPVVESLFRSLSFAVPATAIILVCSSAFRGMQEYGRLIPCNKV